jgi:aspartokinase-like uncharacterized kinase
MLYQSIIVKIGGKILENKENLESTILQFKYICEKNFIQKIIIIPGGGKYANFVRMLDKKISIGDELSHWMAIFAMNCNGIEISQKYNDIKDFDNLDELKKSKEKIVIFLPYDFLYQLDELPHSWSVTSDSITLYIAHQLGLKDCFLIKDIDGIISNNYNILRELTSSEYKNLKKTNKILTINTNREKRKDSQPIDSYIINLINKYNVNCIILNGSSNKKRIITFFEESEDNSKRFYTKIIA